MSLPTPADPLPTHVPVPFLPLPLLLLVYLCLCVLLCVCMRLCVCTQKSVNVVRVWLHRLILSHHFMMWEGMQMACLRRMSSSLKRMLNVACLCSGGG
jgi:hypothetical protein